MGSHHLMTFESDLLGPIQLGFDASGPSDNRDLKITDVYVETVETGRMGSGGGPSIPYSRARQIDLPRELWPIIRLNAWDAMQGKVDDDELSGMRDGYLEAAE